MQLIFILLEVILALKAVGMNQDTKMSWLIKVLMRYQVSFILNFGD